MEIDQSSFFLLSPTPYSNGAESLARPVSCTLFTTLVLILISLQTFFDCTDTIGSSIAIIVLHFTSQIAPIAILHPDAIETPTTKSSESTSSCVNWLAVLVQEEERCYQRPTRERRTLPSALQLSTLSELQVRREPTFTFFFRRQTSVLQTLTTSARNRSVDDGNNKQIVMAGTLN